MFKDDHNRKVWKQNNSLWFYLCFQLWQSLSRASTNIRVCASCVIVYLNLHALWKKKHSLMAKPENFFNNIFNLFYCRLYLWERHLFAINFTWVETSHSTIALKLCMWLEDYTQPQVSATVVCNIKKFACFISARNIEISLFWRKFWYFLHFLE